MTIESAFLSMMPSTVTIYGKTSRDAYGKVTYGGSGTDVRCRVVPENRVVRTDTDVEVFEDGRIYCYGTPTVSYDDKVLLPSGEQVTVVSILVQYDETGTHHTVIGFGRTRA